MKLQKKCNALKLKHHEINKTETVSLGIIHTPFLYKKFWRNNPVSNFCVSIKTETRKCLMPRNTIFVLIYRRQTNL
jgi:hypothetical protein